MHGSTLVRNALQLARRTQRAHDRMASPVATRDRGIGRRHFLKLLGTGAAVLSAPAAARGTRPERVAIVGGGLAGLNALRLLTEAGVEATLYESRPRVGGRVLTRAGLLGIPQRIELGGQFVNSDHQDVIALCRRFNVPLIDRSALAGHEAVVRDRVRVETARVAVALGPLAAEIARLSERLDADYDRYAPAIDHMSVSAFLNRYTSLVREDFARVLIEQTIRTEYGVEPTDASALELVFNLPTVEGDAFETLGDSDERYVIGGGSSALVDALAAPLADRIHLRRALVALRRARDGAVELRFADGSSVSADRVILTLPASLLGGIDDGGLFHAGWRAFAREVTLGRNEKLNAAYAARPWEATVGAAGALWETSRDPLFAEAWDCSVGQPGPAGALTWYLGGDQTRATDARELRAMVEGRAGDALGDLAGAARPGALLTRWGSEPDTRGAYVNFRPGQLSRFGGLLWVEDEGVTTQIARSGPILFAGEHVSDAWPGFMNGGAQTGRLAAQAILDGR